jgi:plasmid maintenance system antidote protein VapI
MTPTKHPKRPGIRRAYTDMGLTRKRFAQRVDLSPQTVTNIVNGTVGMSDATINRIAEALGWTRDDVLRGERILEREEPKESEHVSPEPLPPSRPPEPTRPPNRNSVLLAEAS